VGAKDVGAKDADASGQNIDTKVFAKLSKLIGQGADTLVVAFSGGGDSTALLSLVVKWAGKRSVCALIVDHGLRDGSRDEAKLALRRALAMGASAKILTCHWQDGIPKTGIQEKARKARYHVLAQACQGIGACKLLLGHNVDDQAETVLMRKDAGSGWRGLAGMAERAAYPVWPIVQDVVIIRPLLMCTREVLRTYNRENGLAWIDDPSNENHQFTRIRVRNQLMGKDDATQKLLIIAKAAREIVEQERGEINQFIQSFTEIYEWGGIAILPGFSKARIGQIAEALKYLIPAISGQETAPNIQKRMQLTRRLRRINFDGATLGGVRFVPRKDDILCVRDPGAVIGRTQVKALPALELAAHKPDIWDGRFKVISKMDAVTVMPLGLWQNTLKDEHRALLNALPETVRACFPVFIRNESIIHIPFVDYPAPTHGFSAVSLIGTRLASLLGHFD